MSTADMALQMARDEGNPAGVGMALMVHGQAERDHGRNAAALKAYREGVAIWRQTNRRSRLAYALRHVADLARQQGELSEAAAAYAEALEIYRGLHPAKPGAEANTLRGYALLCELQHDPDRARPMWERARQLFKALRIPAGVDECERRLQALVVV